MQVWEKYAPKILHVPKESLSIQQMVPPHWLCCARWHPGSQTSAQLLGDLCLLLSVSSPEAGRENKEETRRVSESGSSHLTLCRVTWRQDHQGWSKKHSFNPCTACREIYFGPQMDILTLNGNEDKSLSEVNWFIPRYITIGLMDYF